MARDNRRSAAGKRARKWYRSKRWQRKRAAQLRKHPWCQCPHHVGKFEPADTVDHTEPHNGDHDKFWNGELQSMTKLCHDKFKQSQEKGGAGFLKGSDEQGEPLDQTHPWYG